jgi:hypothetical protein
MPRGAKPGERRGGRGKNTPNKRTNELQELINEAKALGWVMPVEYMLYILNTGDDAAKRWAATAAAPYCHPRAGEAQQQPTVNINGPSEVRLVIIDHAEQSRTRSSARLLSATPAGHS